MALDQKQAQLLRVRYVLSFIIDLVAGDWRVG
jgi:hypothetical protein